MNTLPDGEHMAQPYADIEKMKIGSIPGLAGSPLDTMPLGAAQVAVDLA
jgi:hypothetical protein